jgi:hypothetical protein
MWRLKGGPLRRGLRGEEVQVAARVCVVAFATKTTRQKAHERGGGARDSANAQDRGGAGRRY